MENKIVSDCNFQYSYLDYASIALDFCPLTQTVVNLGSLFLKGSFDLFASKTYANSSKIYQTLSCKTVAEKIKLSIPLFGTYYAYQHNSEIFARTHVLKTHSFDGIQVSHINNLDFMRKCVEKTINANFQMVPKNIEKVPLFHKFLQAIIEQRQEDLIALIRPSASLKQFIITNFPQLPELLQENLDIIRCCLQFDPLTLWTKLDRKIQENEDLKKEFTKECILQIKWDPSLSEDMLVDFIQKCEIGNNFYLNNLDLLMKENQFLQSNKKIVKEMTLKNCNLFQYASEALKNDRQFVDDLIESTVETFKKATIQFYSNNLKNEEDPLEIALVGSEQQDNYQKLIDATRPRTSELASLSRRLKSFLSP